MTSKNETLTVELKGKANALRVIRGKRKEVVATKIASDEVARGMVRFLKPGAYVFK